MIDFLDAILFYTNENKEHEEHLRLVMKVLEKKQIYAKVSKYCFYQNKTHCLGHIVSKEGTLVDPKKILSIMNWEIPKNVSFYVINRLLLQVYR